MNIAVKSLASTGWHQPSTTAIWQREFESLPNVRRIIDTNIELMRQMLAGYENVNSYLTSPNYYLFSGRNGLWAIEDIDALLLLCWHPNIPGKIIAFPQVKGNGNNLIDGLLASIPMPPNGLMVGRVQEKETPAYIKNLLTKSTAIFHAQKEDVLDWAYPVHILSTYKVSALSGQEFMYVRNRLRQLHKHSVKILPFDAIHHSRSMEYLLHRWVSQRAADQLEYENLYAPYEALFSMGINPLSELYGLMIYVDNQLEALGLWDISGSVRKTGNLFVNLCNTTIKGLSEFLIVKCCEMLYGQNIEHLNIGGSETEGLDNFKRKFHPQSALNFPLLKPERHTAFTKTWDGKNLKQQDMFKLKDQISIRLQNTEIVGRLVGVDQYEMESFSGKKCRWPSYTLVSDAKGLFSRYWFVLWDKSKWILWTKARNPSVAARAKLIHEKSGIVHIAFTGDAGPSTPIAALVQYKLGNEFFCIERFSGSQVMFFAGQKIQKNPESCVN